MDVLYSFCLSQFMHINMDWDLALIESLDQAIWPAIQEEKLDGFIFLGDSIYGDQQMGSF